MLICSIIDPNPENAFHTQIRVRNPPLECRSDPEPDPDLDTIFQIILDPDLDLMLGPNQILTLKVSPINSKKFDHQHRHSHEAEIVFK